MELIRCRAYARAGLLGNPSDGYQGKTIAIVVRDLFADVVLYEWEEIELISSQEDHSRFASIHDLSADVDLHGYYGGIRLVKATIKKFADYCRDQKIELHDRRFSIRYESNIPRQVGLAGSSAIIVATLSALIDFYKVSISKRVQPSLVLSVETDELGISAGLQDRVIQVYDGVVYMDFSAAASESITGLVCGTYESLDAQSLPNLYLAYREDSSQPGEIFHNNLRARYDQGDADVVGAMEHFADLARQGREALRAGKPEALAALVDDNFDTRKSICRLPDKQVELVDVARKAGGSAKFAGSGGAIIGTFESDQIFERLQERLRAIGCRVLRPRIS